MPLSELQPYFTAVGALISVTTLGFVLNLAKLASDAAKARAVILEERIKKSQEDVERTEKWSAREKAELQDEVGRLRELLSNVGVTTSLEAKEAGIHLSNEVKSAIDLRMGEIRDLLAKKQSDIHSIGNVAALQLGRGYMATGQWNLASQYLEQYLVDYPQDWQAQFAKGVACANTRGGRASDLAAVRSYNEAITFGMEPGSGLDEANRGRLFIYRGAILKRLGRLEEAERDVRLGKKIAFEPYEQADAAYNLACVYALQQNRDQLLDELKQARTLASHNYVYECITRHMDDYFKDFSSDQSFLDALANLR